MDEIQLDIQPDLVENLSKTKPISAICELIWNSLDADANKVEIFTDYHEMQALSEIKLIDDGLGMRHEEAKEFFKNLGGSWKKTAAKTKKYRRFLHGKEGQGRLKSF